MNIKKQIYINKYKITIRVHWSVKESRLSILESINSHAEKTNEGHSENYQTEEVGTTTVLHWTLLAFWAEELTLIFATAAHFFFREIKFGRLFRFFFIWVTQIEIWFWILLFKRKKRRDYNRTVFFLIEFFKNLGS